MFRIKYYSNQKQISILNIRVDFPIDNKKVIQKKHLRPLLYLYKELDLTVNKFILDYS